MDLPLRSEKSTQNKPEGGTHMITKNERMTVEKKTIVCNVRLSV